MLSFIWLKKSVTVTQHGEQEGCFLELS